MVMETFAVKDSRPTISRNPASRLIYGVDLNDWLAETGTALSTVTCDAVGVAVDGLPFIQSGFVFAWVTGFDTALNAENSVKFKFVCADGSFDDVTIYFTKRP